ncbi:MAG: ABC transporter permease subunit, partial [Verrucomicrobiales bacterium]|nr:ABC transporter permease subunit [Verrucomicrobiales bacterium]
MLRLQLRNELWKLFGKKRTYIGFGMLLAAQWLVVLVFRFSGARGGAVRALETNGYDAAGYLSGLTFAGIMLFPIAYILMPLYIALVGGDLVAKEAEDGTLRLILSRPISRVRLLGVKWLAGVLFCAVLVALLGVTGLLVSGLFFGKGGMFVFVPGEIFGVYGPGEGAWRYAL